MKKPAKPYPEFPLFAHSVGLWAKKIRGKTWYFGPWRDPDAALKKYMESVDQIRRAGKKPEATDATTVEELANLFMSAKQSQMDAGELGQRAFREYYTCCVRVLEAFGKTTPVDSLVPAEFEKLRATLAKTRTPVLLTGEVQRVRTLFKYAYDAGLVDKPVRVGPMFRGASQRSVREARNARPLQFLDHHELRTLIDAAKSPTDAMILLAINCGFGQGDIAKLPLDAVDLESGWIVFPRPKTAIPRECPLWPETIAALSVVLANRKPPDSPELASLVFITRKNQPFVHYHPDTGATTDAVGLAFRRLRMKCGLMRPGSNFYAIRHTFQTIADNAKDPVAIRRIMGHTDPQGDMSAVYREKIDRARLVAVSDHVRNWLFPAKNAN